MFITIEIPIEMCSLSADSKCPLCSGHAELNRPICKNTGEKGPQELIVKPYLIPLRLHGRICTPMESTMGVTDEVVCNHPLFGQHRGKTYQTYSLDAIFPGARYEITASGRLQLLVCNYENRSDPNAVGMAKIIGIMTPVLTCERRDVNYHGWLELRGIGRAKFTDGTLVAFEEFPPMQGML